MWEEENERADKEVRVLVKTIRARAEVDSPEDQRFEEELEKIYRGLLGLPLETP